MRRASSGFVQWSGAPHHGKTTTSNKQQKVASTMVRTRRSSQGKQPPQVDPFDGPKRHRLLATHAAGVPLRGRGTAECLILLQLVFAASLLLPGRASTQNSLSISPNFFDPSMGSRSAYIRVPSRRSESNKWKGPMPMFFSTYLCWRKPEKVVATS